MPTNPTPIREADKQVEVITRWSNQIKPFEEISVDGGKTWWTKEQFKNLQALLTKHTERAELEGRVEEATVIAGVRTRAGAKGIRQFAKDRAKIYKTRLEAKDG